MEALLTRRQTLQSLAYAAVFGGSLLGLVGCGGGGKGHGGGGAIRTATVRVPVTLPEGFPIPASDLVGGTAFGTAPVDATGFSAKINPNAPTFAYLRQRSTGRMVLFGLVGEGRPGLTPLGAASALMALALGLTGLPPEAVASGLGGIEGRPAVTALADAIANAMATDPTVLARTEDSPLAASIKAAYDSLSTPVSGATRGVASRAAAKPLVQVQPSDEQHGARVDQGSEGTIVPTNLRRRPIAAYTYRTGHVPATADAEAHLLDQQDIDPTTSLVGSVVTLGSAAVFADRPGHEVALPVSGDDDKTLYETVVLYPSASFADPDFFGEERYRDQLPEWKAKRNDLQEYSFVWGILLDLFKVASGAAAVAISVKDALSFSRELAFFQQAGGRAVIQQALNGEFGVASQQAVKLAAQSDTLGEYLREALGRILVKAKVATEGAVSGEGLAAIASAAGLALAASGALLALADARSTYNDLQGLPKGVRWTETALQPKLRITPRTGEIRQGGSLGLSVDLVALPGVGISYTWTLTGSSFGTLTGDSGSGKSITTTGTAITLAVTPSDPEGQVATVTVEAKDRDGKSLGTDTAKLTVVGNAPVVEGGTFTVLTHVDETSEAAVAAVTFAKVKGATSYAVHGTGGDDPAYYHREINLSYNPKNPPTGPDGKPLLFGVGLSGAFSSPGDLSGKIAYFQNRFAGFTFTVTAYFGN